MTRKNEKMKGYILEPNIFNIKQFFSYKFKAFYMTVMKLTEIYHQQVQNAYGAIHGALPKYGPIKKFHLGT